MTDILSEEGIRKYLKNPDVRLTVLEETGSTNNLLKELAKKGEPEYLAVIAASQSAGKGRLGRSFYSPSGTGIYMSLLLRPATIPPEKTMMITTMAAVAACEAAEDAGGGKPGIKWVNDIFINGKKAAGILTEAGISANAGRLDYAVMGIGFNAYEPEGGFPAELKDIAGSVFDGIREDGRNRLAAAFLDRFMSHYEKKNAPDYVESYRRYCFVTGKRIRVIGGAEEREGTALGLDDECRLLVEYDDGNREFLSSGEISIRITRP